MLNVPKKMSLRFAAISPQRRAYIGLLSVVLTWSLLPVFLKQLLDVLTPVELTFTRFFISGLVMSIWILPRRMDEVVLIFRQDCRRMLLFTLFGPLLAMLCFNLGLRNLTVGTAAMFVALEPIFTYLLAILFGQERWRTGRMFSIFLALIGIAMIIVSREHFGVDYWLSLVLIALSPLIWAVNNILSKELAGRHAAEVLTTVSFLLSSLLLLPFLSADLLAGLAGLSPCLWLILSYCVICNVVGFSIWYWSFKYLPPTTVSLSLYLLPILSVSAGILMLGESLSLLKGVGIVVVLVGLYLANIRFR